jgi:hypothetical protein
MAKIGVDQIEGYASPPHDFDERPFRVNRALSLVPILGFFAFAYGMNKWRPLNPAQFYWVGFGLFFIAVFLISHIRKQEKAGEDVRSYFPWTTWLAFAPAFVGLVVCVNGALDHAPVATHQQFVTGKYISRGRSTSYYIEFTSWRPDRTTERASVSTTRYAEFQIDDPVFIDVHKGALGIEWMGTIRKTATDDLR